MRAVMKFADRVELTVKSSFGGSDIKINSLDRENAELTERFSYVFNRSQTELKQNYQTIYDNFIAIAKKHDSYDDFVNAYEAATGLKKEIMKVEDKDFATVSVKNGTRGNEINFQFSDGVKVSMKINKSSVSYDAPTENPLLNSLTSMVMGQHMMRVDKDITTENMVNAVKNSRDMTELVANFESEIHNRSAMKL